MRIKDTVTIVQSLHTNKWIFTASCAIIFQWKRGV